MPVVGVTAAFTLTPLFAHNQNAVLNQLLSPSSSIAYDTPAVDFNNVEVFSSLLHFHYYYYINKFITVHKVIYPAFDYLSPDLVDLYVTNDGSQLPSYVFRQLTEYYHPKDYVL